MNRDMIRGPHSTVFSIVTLTLLAGMLVGSPSRFDSAHREATSQNFTAPKPTPASNSGSMASGLPTVGDHDPRRAIQEFWETAKQGDGKALAEELVLRSCEMDLEFLIATVPDPIDSRFDYRFDAILDDLQLAVESLGWNLDRFWLPWRPTGQQPGKQDVLSPVIDQHDKEERFELRLSPKGPPLISGRYGVPADDSLAPADSKSALHLREPGILVFRKPRRAGDMNPIQQVLIVFLVGERPTSGLNKVALGRALNVIDYFERNKHQAACAPQKPIVFRIVGPYFTGSERSLSMVISQWTREHPAYQDNKPNSRRHVEWRFVVRSGASNRIQKPKFLTDCGDDSRGPVQVEFHATLLHFDRVMETLFRFMKKLNGNRDLGKVALLTESDTEFGRVEIPGTGSIEQVWGVKTVTHMKFPFHVSQVAIAYDQNRSTADKTTPTLARPSSKLRIPFDETGTPRDIVPSLSPAMTAATDEFNLAKILETISLENYRYVGIVASDTRDVVFLAGLIREFCPDVQLFTPAGDVLLGHPTYAAQLRGMIVASPYPLFSMAQRWDPPHQGDRRRHLFTHENDQGYYNATVSILAPGSGLTPIVADGEPGHESSYYSFMYDYGRPFDALDDQDSREPSSLNRADLQPPLWLSVIGQRGIWPLTYDQGSVLENLGFIFLPRPDAVGTQPSPWTRLWLEHTIPLIPQFSWLWGTIVLVLAGLLWMLLFAHCKIAVGRCARGSLMDLLRPITRSERTGLLWVSHEAFAWGLVATGFVVFSYIVVYPCHITLRHSPWALFGSPAHMNLLSWDDCWNWQFGLVACWLALGGVSALTAVGAIRASWVLKLSERACSPPGVPIGIVFAALIGVSCLHSHLAHAPGAPINGLDWEMFGLTLTESVVLVLAALAGYRAFKALGNPPDPGRNVSQAKAVGLMVGVLGLTLGAVFDPPSTPSWLTIQLAEVATVALAAAAGAWLTHPASRNLLTRVDQAGSAWVGYLMLTAPLFLALPALVVAVAFAEPIPPYDSLLYLERALNLGNGVSPLIPVLLLCTATAAWLSCQLRRVIFVNYLWSNRLSAPGTDPLQLKLDQSEPCRGVCERKKRLTEAGHKICQLLLQPVPGVMFSYWGSLFGLGLTILVVLRLIERFVPTIDGLNYNWTMILAFSCLILLVVLSLCRFLLVWRRVHALLREFALLPMQRAFDRIPSSLSREFGPYLNTLRPRLANLEIPVRVWGRVADEFPEEGLIQGLFEKPSWSLGAEDRTRMEDLATAVRGQASNVFKEGEGPSRSILAQFENECGDADLSIDLASSQTREGLQRAAAACLSVLIPYWRTRSPQEGYGDPHPDRASGDGSNTGMTDRVDQSSDSRNDQSGQVSQASNGDFAFGEARMMSRLARMARRESSRADMMVVVTEESLQHMAREESGALHGEAGRCGRVWSGPVRRWLGLAEGLVAFEMITFVGECTVHLKNLATFLTFGPLFLLLAATNYPFQPQRFLTVSIWALLFAVAGGVLWVYIQMERNEILSRVAKTVPNKLTPNWTFLSQTIAILVPLVGIVLAQFPFVSDTVNQWMEPMLRVLK